jgi:hypothetical protein
MPADLSGRTVELIAALESSGPGLRRLTESDLSAILTRAYLGS